MVLDKQGGVYNVDWFFVPPATPLIGVECMASLNWVRPEVGTGGPGEVPASPRTYRKGAKPAYLPTSSTWPITGNSLDFARGAAAQLGVVANLDFAARRRYPPDPAPIFPTFFGAGHVANAQSAVFNYGNGFFDGRAWTWQGPNRQLLWDDPHDAVGAGVAMWECLVPVWTLWVSTNGFVTTTPLRCLTYNAGTQTSTWDDPLGGGLAAGEVVTLHVT